MVDEGWKLSDAIAFATEYKLNITVQDSSGKTIPDSLYNEYTNKTIIEQSGRLVGDPIIEGMSFRVKIDAIYKTEEVTTTESTNQE